MRENFLSGHRCFTFQSLEVGSMERKGDEGVFPIAPNGGGPDGEFLSAEDPGALIAALADQVQQCVVSLKAA